MRFVDGRGCACDGRQAGWILQAAAALAACQVMGSLRAAGEAPRWRDLVLAEKDPHPRSEVVAAAMRVPPLLGAAAAAMKVAQWSD